MKDASVELFVVFCVLTVMFVDLVINHDGSWTFRVFHVIIELLERVG